MSTRCSSPGTVGDRMLRRTCPRRRRLRAAALVVVGSCGLLLPSAPAWTASGSIDHVQARGGSVQLVVSLGDIDDGDSFDLDSVAVSFEGQPLQATAESLSDTGDVRRTTVLAMDVSDSMTGRKFDEAKAAAKAFLAEVPSDVAVGLVTFAGEVTVEQEPTQDADAVAAVVDSLQLARGTRLYDGLRQAVELTGTEGSRSILVLSDGRDTSSTRLSSTIEAVRREQVKVDVVALGQSAEETALLQRVAESGHGTVLNADDPSALSQLFADEAQVLARQVVVTVRPPAELAGREGSLTVALDVGGTAVTDSAFISLPRGAKPEPSLDPRRDRARPFDPGLQVPEEYMYAGIGATSLAGALLLTLTFGGSRSTRRDAIDRSIEAYTRKGSQRILEVERSDGSPSMTRQAVAVAEGVLEGRKGLEAALAARLEAAGLSLKAAEWLLLHVGTAVGAGLVGLLLGGAIGMFAGLVIGAAAPWAYLLLAKARRLSKFKAQLADTLQLMAGSLSAGLSLAQALDTVVSEGTDPVAAEFRRALVEARLGVDIEEALAGIADRMQSLDFEWVVMAIRIQRDVGGNLAELLGTVAETIREREYLERQVKTLSAEGRLSVWILAALPPAFLAYLLVASPAYVSPLFSTAMGWIILGAMAVLESVGIVWMKRLVRIEV